MDPVRRMRRAARCLFPAVLLTLALLFSLPCAGIGAGTGGENGVSDLSPEAGEVADEWAGFLDAVPEEVADLLPADFFAADPAAAGEGVASAAALPEILSLVGRAVGVSLRENLALLARLIGLLLLSAVLRALAGSGTGSAGRAYSFLVTLALTLAIAAGQRERFAGIARMFALLERFGASLVPLLGALYAMGGNVRAAAANQVFFTGFLSLLSTVLSGTVLPVAGLCLALALLDALAGSLSLRPLAALLKRSYTLGVSFLMLLLCFSLGVQTTLAAGSDTLALRTARFAAGSFLPVVGGSVSETLRTVAGSVTYLRGVAGTGAMIVLFLTFLSPFLSIALARLAFSLAGAAAKLFDLTAEEKLLAEFASVWGYFLAVLAALFVLIVFALTLFARCATAI